MSKFEISIKKKYEDDGYYLHNKFYIEEKDNENKQRKINLRQVRVKG